MTAIQKTAHSQVATQAPDPVGPAQAGLRPLQPDLVAVGMSVTSALFGTAEGMDTASGSSLATPHAAFATARRGAIPVRVFTLGALLVYVEAVVRSAASGVFVAPPISYWAFGAAALSLAVRRMADGANATHLRLHLARAFRWR